MSSLMPAGNLSATDFEFLSEDLPSQNVVRHSVNSVVMEEAEDLSLMSLLKQLDKSSIAEGIIGTLFHQSIGGQIRQLQQELHGKVLGNLLRPENRIS